MSDKKTSNQSRYQRSNELLEKALRVIPLGSQTFSKSKTQYPEGASPFFIKRGKGSRVWDVDGNEYIDFVNALASVTLGYNDPDVNKAVTDQLEEGVIFTLPHPIEVEVAEKIVEMVPCAEMVRFGKNGSDATAGAVRLARAYTGRDHVLVCGYHGWQDWFIGSTLRNKGVPQCVRDLVHSFEYNNIDSARDLFKKYKDGVAAVILEPMNVTFPKPGFLEELKELTHQNGALLVFDETITGFRFSNGGAQEFFNVTPDLATFGKGLANGFPVSAVVGSEKIMRLMEEIFFSFTFGGETLSLAAANATLKKLQTEPVIKTISKNGKYFLEKMNQVINQSEMGDIFSTSGHPSWPFLILKDAKDYTQWELKTFFLQEIFKRGIITLGSHNMSYSHSVSDIDTAIGVYDIVLKLMKSAILEKNLTNQIHCKMLEPLFKIR